MYVTQRKEFNLRSGDIERKSTPKIKGDWESDMVLEWKKKKGRQYERKKKGE